jgi:hypothetical protein
MGDAMAGLTIGVVHVPQGLFLVEILRMLRNFV